MQSKCAMLSQHSPGRVGYMRTHEICSDAVTQLNGKSGYRNIWSLIQRSVKSRRAYCRHPVNVSLSCASLCPSTAAHPTYVLFLPIMSLNASRRRRSSLFPSREQCTRGGVSFGEQGYLASKHRAFHGKVAGKVPADGTRPRSRNERAHIPVSPFRKLNVRAADHAPEIRPSRFRES
jgi:hypothetical protein